MDLIVTALACAFLFPSRYLIMTDVVRLDHFIGFARNWAVPAGDETAENGEWLDVPGRELFSALRANLGELPIIAEDLGAMTEEVARLRDDLGFSGMRVLENAFGGGKKGIIKDLGDWYYFEDLAKSR